MSIQKKFETFLKEDVADHGQARGRAMVGAPPGVPSIDDVVMGDAFNIQKPENIQKLNGYLAAASASPVINPYFLAKRIQDKLSQIGLSFDVPMIVGDTGHLEKPITQFGGVYGYEHPLGHPYPDGVNGKELGALNFPDINSGDGISQRIPGGLAITFSWTRFKGMYTIHVELVPGQNVAPAPIKEEDLEEAALDEKHIGFEKLERKLSHKKGVSDPAAVAAAIGNKKYGKAKMQHAAHSGHKLHEDELDEAELEERRLKGLPRLKKGTPSASAKEVGAQGAVNIRRIKEDALDEVSPPGFSGTTKAMKKHKGITNPFALAWWMKNKGYKSHKPADK